MIYDKPTGEVFASKANIGESAEFPDIRRGWGITKEQTASKPPMSWMNGAFKRIDENLEYLRQRGIAEWDEKLTYPTGAYVQHKGKSWKATSENIGKEPSVDDEWTEWGLTKGEVLLKNENLGDLTNVSAAQKNLGLGTAAKLSAPNIVIVGDRNGYYSFPGIHNGKQVEFITQFGMNDAQFSGTNVTPSEIFFNIPFPNKCLNVVATDFIWNMGPLDWGKNLQSGRVALDFDSVNVNNKTYFLALAEGSFSWYAVGY